MLYLVAGECPAHRNLHRSQTVMRAGTAAPVESEPFIVLLEDDLHCSRRNALIRTGIHKRRHRISRNILLKYSGNSGKSDSCP